MSTPPIQGARLLRVSPVTTTGYKDCLSESWLAERLAIDPVKIDVMRRAGELIAVRATGSTEWLYPAWQFKGSVPRRIVLRLVNAARETGLGESRLYEVLTAPMGIRGDRRLVDLILEGRDEEVVEAVRSAR
jgi:hypothetical protein